MKAGHMAQSLILRGNLQGNIKLILQTIATCDDVEWNTYTVFSL